MRMTLSDYLNRQKITRAAFGVTIGAHPITVQRWCSGAMRPSWPRLAAIEAATNGAVTAADFVPRAEERAA